MSIATDTTLGNRRRAEDKVNILLVDDQQGKLLSYEAILGGLGENLITAKTGAEALERLLKDDFAVLLVDVCMPGMDGFELVEMIRQHHRFQRTAIIFVSAVHLTDLDRLRGYGIGAVDYVSVPVVPDILRAKVAVFADLYRARRDLERMNSELERRVSERTADLEASLMRLQESEQQLRVLDRRKDEFIATLAHELRNPLAPIRNSLEILKQENCSEQEQVLARQRMERQLAQLVRLIDDLLEISRVNEDKLDLRIEPVDIATVIKDAVENVKLLIEDNNQKLSIVLPRKRAVIEGDSVRLAQVFANLVNNASKFTPQGGRIELHVEHEPRHVLVSVRDDGIGIEKQDLELIFEPFFQVNRSLERHHTGLGVGLTLVRKLVELHGGVVDATSEGPGKGSEFKLRIPTQLPKHLRPVLKVSAPSDPLTSTTAKVTAAQARRPLRVLVVDDNRDAAESSSVLLQMYGHEAFTAFSGEEALAATSEVRPDVVLLDIGLPDINGYKVAEQIRAQEWGKKITLVALTGWGQEDDKRRAKLAGFDHHMTKPIDHARLNALLEQAPASQS